MRSSLLALLLLTAAPSVAASDPQPDGAGNPVQAGEEREPRADFRHRDVERLREGSEVPNRQVERVQRIERADRGSSNTDAARDISPAAIAPPRLEEGVRRPIGAERSRRWRGGDDRRDRLPSSRSTPGEPDVEYSRQVREPATGRDLRDRIAGEGLRRDRAERDNWRRDWRQDRRYDWRRHRDRDRHRFDLGLYIDPFGWRYREWDIGWRLPSRYYASRYWIYNPWSYRLPPVPGYYRWVRYYDDVLLVDLRSGRIVDRIRNFFW